MAMNYKVPPTFSEECNYDGWKNEVEIWRLVTDLDIKKQALAVTLSLTGKPREVALEIPSATLNADDGMTVLIAALDKVFLSDEQDNSYAAYTNFEQFKKTADMSMNDYIIEFERRYNKTKKFHMDLPDPVLAFKLLDSCNLNYQEKQLALTATGDKTFKSMKAALKRIFGGNTSASVGETAFYTKQQKYSDKYKQSGRQQEYTKHKNKLNPLNKYGKPSRCSICQSIYHWRKNCPHDQSDVNFTSDTDKSGPQQQPEDCNVTLFTKESHNEHEIFVIESLGSAIIDTACTRTVCGEKWLQHFKDSLNNHNKKKFFTEPSQKVFRFGDGKTVYSTKIATIPAKIGDTRCSIQTEVVPAEIPLLLSKESLQKAGTVLDLKHDKAEMFDKQVPLELTSSGHYCINVLDDIDDDVEPDDIILIVNGDVDSKENRDTIVKLHKQFGHASAERLKKLLQSAGVQTEKWIDLLKRVVQECDVCVRYKQTPPKPAVSLPMANDFNETVSVDLHELDKGIWYLHIIDMFTRFSAGSIMRTKRPSEFIKHFMKSWISIHGPPKTLFSDNGGEFNNEEVRTMAEKFNIEVKTTAAYSPWSNGLLERHNRTLTEMMLKIKLDTKYDWETSLHWALMAKNVLLNVHGFSPYQLLYGKNPNLPSVMIDKLPALEDSTTSQTVAQHIKALYSARKAFTEAECSERIRRAIRKQIRPTGDKFVTGEKVFYKRPDSPEWKGPGTVIGQDSVVVFVRHGGTYVRVHQSRLQRVHNNEPSPEIQEQNDTKATVSNAVMKRDSNLDEDDELENNEPPELENNENIENNEPPQNIHQDPNIAEAAVHEPPQDRQNEPNVAEPARDINVNQERIQQYIKLQSGDLISFKEPEQDNRSVGKILGRAGKAKGKLKNWYNFEYTMPVEKTGMKISLDVSTVDDLQHEHDDDIDDVMVMANISFEDAKIQELNNWVQNKVYDVVKDNGQKSISTRWVCTIKNNNEPKARLVARGFEDLESFDLPKDSPTCSTESLRIILSIIAQRKWSVHTIDIKTAFLQGSALSRDVYLRPPKEACSQGLLWKLNKCVYGLSDASLGWYKRVCEVMKETGARKSMVDPAVFYWVSTTGEVIGILASHVDDFIWAGTETFQQDIIPKIRAAFLIGKEGTNSFSYVGININHHGQYICLDQQNYVDNLQSIPIERIRQLQKDEPLTTKEKDDLRSKIGQLLWLARQSRPDIHFEVCSLATSLKSAKVQHIIDANKVIRKVKNEMVKLKYQHLGSDSELKLVTYSDASFGNLPDGGTQGGSLVMLMGENNKFSLLFWQSKRIRRIVKSTLAGETLAMTDSIDNAVFVATLFAELYTGKADPRKLYITCVTDNHSLYDAINSNKSVAEKRLRLEISSIKEMIENKQLKQVLWSTSKNQLADCLTKKGASTHELLKGLENGKLDISD